MPGVNGFPFVKVCVETAGTADAIVGYTYAENWSKILAAAGEPPAVDLTFPGHARPPAGIKLKLVPPGVPEEQTVVVYCVQPGTYYFGNAQGLVDSSPLNAGCWEFLGWSY
ncbi:MAG: hypothetical protein KDA22_04885 [Phycisphaerales bacterium]|nr:hypothetical protein [Phycisphaerales bacterium]